MKKFVLTAMAVCCFFVMSAVGATVGTYNLQPVFCQGSATQCSFNPIGTAGSFEEHYDGGGQLAIGSGWTYFPSAEQTHRKSGGPQMNPYDDTNKERFRVEHHQPFTVVQDLDRVRPISLVSALTLIVIGWILGAVTAGTVLWYMTVKGLP